MPGLMAMFGVPLAVAAIARVSVLLCPRPVS